MVSRTDIRSLGYSGLVANGRFLNAVFETVEAGWVQGRIVELPAVITAAPTAEEAEHMLLDALREYVLAVGRTAPLDSAVIGTGGTRRPVEVLLG